MTDRCPWFCVAAEQQLPLWGRIGGGYFRALGRCGIVTMNEAVEHLSDRAKIAEFEFFGLMTVAGRWIGEHHFREQILAGGDEHVRWFKIPVRAAMHFLEI